MTCDPVDRVCGASCEVESASGGEKNEEKRDWRSCRGNILVRTSSYLYGSFGRPQIGCHTSGRERRVRVIGRIRLDEKDPVEGQCISG